MGYVSSTYDEMNIKGRIVITENTNMVGDVLFTGWSRSSNGVAYNEEMSEHEENCFPLSSPKYRDGIDLHRRG
ncbi:hypothetical protein TNCV_1229101 [Trichonephila clavipes]|nr:hypothetical protein TNCV_1229101 [Trichonephila clavipes]